MIQTPKPANSSHKPLVTINNLCKSYGAKQVFVNLNLNIHQGDRIALMGVNGSGKTTLIEMILGLRTFQKGQILYQPNFLGFLQKTQVVFQVGNYPNKMRLSHLIRFYQDFYQDTLPLETVMKFIDILQLRSLWKQRINSFSFGQRKKVEAVLMLMSKSGFFVIDELTAGMDLDARIKVLELFNEMLSSNQSKSMIWITHDPSEIEKLCNRVVVLSSSNLNVVFDGNFDVVRNRFGSLEKMVTNYLQGEAQKVIKGQFDVNF